MNKCYAVGVTPDGDELRCCLDRNHQSKSDHWDAVRDQPWTVDLVSSAWALAGAC